jgi:hypothetical protein
MIDHSLWRNPLSATSLAQRPRCVPNCRQGGLRRIAANCQIGPVAHLDDSGNLICDGIDAAFGICS